MTLLVGGAVATVLGLIGIIVWGREFLDILKGGFPIAMIMGGILAMYVGLDDVQEQLREERKEQEEKLDKAREEIEKVKARAEQYKEEIDRLKMEAEKSP